MVWKHTFLILKLSSKSILVENLDWLIHILKCFEVLEDFLKEMGHMDSPNQ